ARLPVEHGPRARDICLDASLLAGAGRRVAYIVSARLVAERTCRVGCEIVDRCRTAAAEIEDAAGGLVTLQCRHPALDDVADIHEIAGLRAVAKDDERLAAYQAPDEDAEHTLVGIVEGLPGPVDAEHAQRRDAEVEAEVGADGGSMDVALGGVLGDTVVGVGLAGFGFRRRDPFAVAVGRHGARIDEPWHTMLHALLNH